MSSSSARWRGAAATGGSRSASSLVLVAGVAAFALTRPAGGPGHAGGPPRLRDQARQTAGCGPGGERRLRTSRRARIVPTSSHRCRSRRTPSVPPASGPHNAIPYGAGVYGTPPPIDRVIHSLEHGAAIVWYAPGRVGQGARPDPHVLRGPRTSGSRVIVAPYDYPDQGAAGTLPAGTQMALVAWHNVQTCANVNLAAAFGFTSSYAAPPFGQRAVQGRGARGGQRLLTGRGR